MLPASEARHQQQSAPLGVARKDLVLRGNLPLTACATVGEQQGDSTRQSELQHTSKCNVMPDMAVGNIDKDEVGYSTIDNTTEVCHHIFVL